MRNDFAKDRSAPCGKLLCGAQDVERYRAPANKLIDAALKDDAGLKRLEYLCYRIGNRLSGSEALDKAIAWSADEMKRAGLANVRTIPVKVPHWVSGQESARNVAPFSKPLFMLGLGNSVGTPTGGITAEVVAVSTFEELEKLGARAIRGKDRSLRRALVSYNETVEYRVSGPSRAARLGAVAALVRSITPRSLRDPHTGALGYTARRSEIPAAAFRRRRDLDSPSHQSRAEGPRASSRWRPISSRMPIRPT